MSFCTEKKLKSIVHRESYAKHAFEAVSKCFEVQQVMDSAML